VAVFVRSRSAVSDPFGRIPDYAIATTWPSIRGGRPTVSSPRSSRPDPRILRVSRLFRGGCVWTFCSRWSSGRPRPRRIAALASVSSRAGRDCGAHRGLFQQHIDSGRASSSSRTSSHMSSSSLMAYATRALSTVWVPKSPARASCKLSTGRTSRPGSGWARSGAQASSAGEASRHQVDSPHSSYTRRRHGGGDAVRSDGESQVIAQLRFPAYGRSLRPFGVADGRSFYSRDGVSPPPPPLPRRCHVETLVQRFGPVPFITRDFHLRQIFTPL